MNSPHRCTQLLTFVDNRQDASLQASHLSSFVQVAQLRGALHKAMTDAPGRLLHRGGGGPGGGSLLGARFADFAAAPDAVYAARTRAEKALRRRSSSTACALDLQRGWRITMPNLEQTGLLRVGYRVAVGDRR